MHVTIPTGDGLDLEAVWDLPAAPPGMAVVLCHPHPLMRGSMDAPLIRGIAATMAGAGFAVLRFNFRGVGRSEGGWSGGTGEIEDVAAAVSTADAAHPDLPGAIAGWSFGAHTALRWQVRAGDTRPYAGIAPPISLTGDSDLPLPVALPPADRLFVIGDRDQFTTVADLEGYAAEAGARFEVMAGSDHFFAFRERQVADLLIGHFSPTG
ncbi:MAG: alpha/beta fold hydrolase [Actinobacteria bacterium]|nr:alpha/beta fold hydrolase [Actinomycetota bacterium]MBU1866359.1 alpha/beta fold hydrolase [Actinomycetota bacterium]